jgi:Xaa-Pro dipeptidase
MSRFSKTEREQRLYRCAAALEGLGAGCVVLLPGSSFTYLTGLSPARERHRVFAAIVFADGSVDLVAPLFEASAAASCPIEARVHLFADDEDQHRLIADLIATRCGAGARVALEATVPYYFLRGLSAAAPAADFVDGAAVTDRLRAVKSAAEIACLREAAQKTAARMALVPSQLREGMTERELSAAFGPSAMVQIGTTTSRPNESGRDAVLSLGDAIVIDAGDRVEGYRSDVTRTFFFGEPSVKMREVYGVVREAELAAIAAARPGAPAAEIDRAARRVIERAGYGAFFTHRGGHGIGLDFHEIPICDRGNEEPLAPGMVLTAEPGIYLPGAFGVRLEDDLLVTEDGCEVLSGPLPEPS